MSHLRHARALLVALAASAAPGAMLSGQSSPLVVEANGGVAVPLGSFKDGSGPGEGAEVGPSLSVMFVLPGAGRRGLYAGFSQHRFGCEPAGCAAGGRYVATGFDVGLRLKVVTIGPAVPWLRIGGITTRVETGDLPGPDAGVSKLGFGWEAGAGIYIGPNSTVAVNPGVRYARVTTELPGGADLSMRYLMAQLAIVLAF